MAKVIWFDAAGDVKEERETWYSSGSGTRLLMPTAETVYVINYQNKNALLFKFLLNKNRYIINKFFRFFLLKIVKKFL
mgnify:CR=1 FL=1